MLAFIEKCQNTQSIAACCVQSCVAAGWSEWPCWRPNTAERSHNGYVSIRTAPWSNGRGRTGLNDERHVDGSASLTTMGKMRLGRSSVILWAKFCWEKLSHVDVTLTPTTSLYTAENHVHSFVPTLFLNGSVLLQQDNAPCISHCRNCSEAVWGTWQSVHWILQNLIKHLWDVPDKQVQSTEAT